MKIKLEIRGEVSPGQRQPPRVVEPGDPEGRGLQGERDQKLERVRGRVPRLDLQPGPGAHPAASCLRTYTKGTPLHACERDYWPGDT